MSFDVVANNNFLNSCLSKINTCHDVSELAKIRSQVERVVGFFEQIQVQDGPCIRTHGLALKILKEARERESLLLRRQSLYGRVELPQAPRRFESQLKMIAEKHPSLSSGCAHFQYVLSCALRVKSSKLLKQKDVDGLNEFLHKVEGQLGIHHELYGSVSTLCSKIQESLDRKRQLMAQLGSSLPLSQPFEGWSVNDQIKLLVQAQQILRNPFEPKFELSDLFSLIEDNSVSDNLCQLILMLDGDNTATPGKKDFWDHFSELERKANKLAAATQSGLEILRQHKTDGLRAIMQLAPDSLDETHLIVGAGPAGLIHAISLALQNKKFEIIEKRSSDKVPRSNTVTFGKWDPKELEILMFLGTLAHLDDHISFGHNRPHYTETALGDLEDALSKTLSSLCPNEEPPIYYDTQIESIEQNGLRLKTKNGYLDVQSPDYVFATDGVKGTTRQMLGISKINLSQPTKLAFSIYRDNLDPSLSLLDSLKYRVVNVVAGIFMALQILFYALITWQTIEQAASQCMGDGPSGLSRIPKHDYLLQIFRKQEQEVLEGYERQIAVLQAKIDQLEAGAEKNELTAQKQALQQELQTRLETKSRNFHGVLDFAHTVFNPRGHSMKALPMEHVVTYPVDVMVGKAETSTLQLGQTTFFLRGDASHTTDPYSGTGCKTAIEEVLTDHYFLGQNPMVRKSEMGKSILEWGFNASLDLTLGQAFQERLDYYLGTELPEWFADHALQKEQISQEERNSYIRLAALAQLEEHFTPEEREMGKVITNNLILALQKLPNDRLLGLSSKEQNLLNAAKARVMKGLPISDKKLSTLLAKLTCAGHDEGWLLKMILHLQKLSTTMKFFAQLI